MTYSDWNKAYNLLSEELYDAIHTMNVVEVEHRYRYLTSDISSLILSIRPDAYDAIQYQRRTAPLSNRYVLSVAASDVSVDGLTDEEKDALRIFCERLRNLDELQEDRRPHHVLPPVQLVTGHNRLNSKRTTLI